MAIMGIDQLAPLFQGDDATSHVKISRSEVNKYFRRWQYAAATAVADALSMVEYEVQVRDGDSWAQDERHPLTALLRRPNPWLTLRDMLYLLALDITFVGEHYWYVAHNRAEEPAELWPLLGEMKAVVGKDVLIDHYVLKVSGDYGIKEKRYEVDEIVPFRMLGIQSLLKGVGALQAAAGSVKVDDEIQKSQYWAFKQGIFPFFVLVVSEGDPKKRAQLRDEFNAVYAGARHSGKTVTISKTMEIKELSKTPREMDFMQASRQVQEAISAMFRVPAVMMGLTRDVQNRATAEASEYVFAKWNIAPKLLMVEERVNMDLAWREWDEDVRVKFYSPVAEDRDQERQDMEMLSRTFAIAPGDIAERYGYPRPPWGDVPFVPIGYMPYGSAPEPEPPPQQRAQASIEAQVSKPTGYPARILAILGQRHREWQGKFARGYQRVWRGIFGDLERDFLKAFDELPENSWDAMSATTKQGGAARLVDRVLTPESVRRQMRDKSKPHIVRGLILGGDFDKELVELPEGKQWDSRADALQAAAMKYDEGYYQEIATTTHKEMTEAVARALEDRATWKELRARIVDEFGTMKESRAANIATTETTKLMNAGGQAFRDEFDVSHKQWVTSFVNSRDTHIDVHGTVVHNHEPFFVGRDQMQYPGQGRLAEENCNCNCASVAVQMKVR